MSQLVTYFFPYALTSQNVISVIGKKIDMGVLQTSLLSV